MKRKLLFALVLGMLALLLCGGALAAEDHEHEWERLANEHVCSVEGCGESGPHTYVYEQIGLSTSHHYVCSGCESGFYQNHSFSNYVKCEEATCVTKASEKAGCPCGYENVREISDSKLQDHQFTNYVSNNNATCTTNATETAKCKWHDLCRQTDTREIPNSQSSHSWQQNEDDKSHSCANNCGATGSCSGGKATCETRAVCKICENEYGDPKGHDWRQNDDETHSCARNCGVDPAPCSGGTPTCLSAAICADCKNPYGSALSHNWQQNADGATHSCNRGCKGSEDCSGGTATEDAPAICSVCKQPYGEAIPHTHSYTNRQGTLVSGASCTSPAVYNVRCDGCSDESSGKTMTVGSTLPHTPVTDWGSSPDCTTGGWTTGSHCGVCGKVLNDQNYIPPEGHTPVVIPAVAPTCTETGLTEGQKCADCPDILLPQQIVPALGHTPGPEATCTAPQLCVVCSAELAPAKGHVPATDARVEPTCTTTGLTEGSHCSVCNAILLAQQTIPALGHEYDSYYKGPTCTHRAFTHYICTRCGDDYAVNGAGATGHAQNWTGNGQTHASTCATCGEGFNVNCPFIAVTLNEIPVQVCPICGTIGETTLPLTEGSMENAPWGNEIIRGGQIEGTIYAITAVLEHEGEVLPFKKDELVIITLPLEIEEGFQLVRIDWIEGVETWTELEYSCKNGTLTFETQTGGLFLLLPI